ncbi:hypothetical protein BAE44_0001686 [Dichanthelium oligosanthes]|uniref:S-locus glycoprotein domain-containing protein n=1 Tax=Dichanthelium oligosanthes TaxID=888268 RepID=A0A1E5WIR7_9POAL|nr:hypothetical protein BAE44_0001686 [Dichanthelium oligosanthes]
MYPSSPSSMVYQTIANKGDDFYLEIVVSGGSPYSPITLDHTGTMKLLTWDSNSSSWTVFSERPKSSYGLYDSCGPNGYCDFTGAAPRGLSPSVSTLREDAGEQNLCSAAREVTLCPYPG